LLPGAAGLAAVALPLAFGTVLGVHVHAQLAHPADGPAPTFEVATIRPSRTAGALLNYHISTARFQAENAPLTALIRFAYDIKSDDQLPKEPGWIASEKFDIDTKVEDSEVEAMGKLPPDQKLEQYRLMVQSLLAERFKLRVSTRTKELPVYALVVAKNGPHLTPVNVSPEQQVRRMPTLTGGSRGELKAGAVSMAIFTGWLSGRPDTGNRVVIDATGLKGSYDFTLNWTPDDVHIAQFNGAGAGQGPANTSPPESSGLSIFTALQEQLGLKLKSRKAPVEVLVIDHVERPSPN
jgi:uncharacterized protein (TIGR03435 family)